MKFEEYRKLDAIALAGLIASRQVSAEEVLEAAGQCRRQHGVARAAARARDPGVG